MGRGRALARRARGVEVAATLPATVEDHEINPDRDYSTTDSDAEVDALVAQTYAREQYHRLSDHQQELLEHAMREAE